MTASFCGAEIPVIPELEDDGLQTARGSDMAMVPQYVCLLCLYWRFCVVFSPYIFRGVYNGGWKTNFPKFLEFQWEGW